MKTFLLFLLLPIMAIAQQKLGINTTTPQATLDINGNVIIRNLPIGTVEDTILVIRNGEIMKVPASYYQYTPPTNCPILITGQGQSNGYLLKFKSNVAILNPSASLVIDSKTFQPAGNWTAGNNYFYTYTNVSGVPLNINVPFNVNFSGQICNY